MLFCPYDGSLLLVENKTGTMAFFCQCCAYVQPIESMVSAGGGEERADSAKAGRLGEGAGQQ